MKNETVFDKPFKWLNRLIEGMTLGAWQTLKGFKFMFKQYKKLTKKNNED